MMMMRTLETVAAPYIALARLYLRAMWKLAGVREHGATWWLVVGNLVRYMADSFLDIKQAMLEGEGVGASIVSTAIGSAGMGFYLWFMWGAMGWRRFAVAQGDRPDGVPRGIALFVVAVAAGPWWGAVVMVLASGDVPELLDMSAHFGMVTTLVIATGLAGDDNNKGEPYVATAIRKVFELGRGVTKAPAPATVGVGR